MRHAKAERGINQPRLPRREAEALTRPPHAGGFVAPLRDPREGVGVGADGVPDNLEGVNGQCSVFIHSP